MSDHDLSGRAAENQAADYLLSLGYCVVTRNFRVREGEIDLICLDGDVLVFVEVKGRSAPGYRPEEGIGEQKLERLQRAAAAYMRRMNDSRRFRFDVVAIDGEGLRHHIHIFND